MRLPVPLVKMIINALGRLLRDAADGREIGDTRAAHGLGRAEVMEQGALARWANALDLVERIGADGLGAARAMGADRKAVGFVAQALDEIEHGIARFEHDGAIAARNVEVLAAGIAVRSLRDADERDVVDAVALEYLTRDIELAETAVDEHHVRLVGEHRLLCFLRFVGRNHICRRFRHCTDIDRALVAA